MGRDEVQQLDAGAVELLAGSKDDKQRRFRMLANTGAEIVRPWGRAVFDLSGIETGVKVPILLDHDRGQRVGFADKQQLTDDGLVLFGVLSKATNAGQEVAELSDEGFPWQASIGIHVSSWEELTEDGEAEVNGRTVKGPISIARKGRMLESSFLMAGADHKTHAIALAAAQRNGGRMTPEQFLEAHGDVVAAWKQEAAEQACADLRKDLSVYVAEFDDAAYALKKFTEGRSLLEAKADLSDVLKLKLAEQTAKVAGDVKIMEALQVNAPGVGFDGPAAQGDQPKDADLSLRERAEKLWPKVKGEFANNKNAFLLMAERGEIEELAK